jgi:hypothetical protein
VPAKCPKHMKCCLISKTQSVEVVLVPFGWGKAFLKQTAENKDGQIYHTKLTEHNLKSSFI